MILNALCKHDISTDDHTDCLKRGKILLCPMTCTDFESRTEGIQDTVITAIDEAYKRGYRDGQMDLRKEQEATQKYWGKKPEATIETILQLIRNDIDAYLVEQEFGSEYRDKIKAFVKTPWEGKE